MTPAEQHAHEWLRLEATAHAETQRALAVAQRTIAERDQTIAERAVTIAALTARNAELEHALNPKETP